MMCHTHFDMFKPGADWDAIRKLEAACEECKALKEEERARIQRMETIDPTRTYGQHIALYCINHPELRWSTKNISHIGARSIFFAPGSGTECLCSINELEVVKVDEDGV